MEQTIEKQQGFQAKVFEILYDIRVKVHAQLAEITVPQHWDSLKVLDIVEIMLEQNIARFRGGFQHEYNERTAARSGKPEFKTNVQHSCAIMNITFSAIPAAYREKLSTQYADPALYKTPFVQFRDNPTMDNAARIARLQLALLTNYFIYELDIRFQAQLTRLENMMQDDFEQLDASKDILEGYGSTINTSHLGNLYGVWARNRALQFTYTASLNMQTIAMGNYESGNQQSTNAVATP